MSKANHVAYTAPINPPGATPILTIAQVWAGLQLKIRAGQDFVGGAILSTDVISETTSTDGKALPVVVREAVFRDGNRRVREVCTSYAPMKVEFLQPDGGVVVNIVARGGGGKDELFMTYAFEWLHPEADEGGLAELREKEEKLAAISVENTIKVMREMVLDGRIQA